MALIDEQFWTQEEVGPRSGNSESSERKVREVKNQPSSPSTSSSHSSGRTPTRARGNTARSRTPRSRNTPSLRQTTRSQSPGRKWSSHDCYACKKLDKPSEHVFWECPLWQSTRREGAPEKGSEDVRHASKAPPQERSRHKPLVCYTCQALKLPCEHDFRKCPEVEKARKPKGPEGNSKNTPAGRGKNSRPDEPSGVHSG